MSRRPSLVRAARAFGLLATLAVILIAIFVVLAAYSAGQLRPATGSNSTPAILPGPDNSVLVWANVSVDNPGYFAVTGVGLHAVVRLPGTAGPILATGESGVVSIPAGQQGTIPLELRVPISSSEDAPLLTNDLTLPGWAWMNATYAQVFGFELSIPRNLSWGAPFHGLSLLLGAPSPLANGTSEAPMTVAFSDHSSFPIAGRISYEVRDPAGAQCSTGSLPVAVGSETSFQGRATVYVPSNCSSAGGTVSVSFTGTSWNVLLGQEPWP